MVNNNTAFQYLSLSDTQRIKLALSQKGLTISKQWRKTKEENFKTSKGIDVPASCLDLFMEFLKIQSYVKRD